MKSVVGPIGPKTDNGTLYISMRFVAPSEREALNGLFQMMFDAMQAEEKTQMVWRNFPHAIAYPEGGFVAHARVCFE